MGRHLWVGDDGALRHGWWWTSLGFLLVMLGVVSRAAALPSYSWQTGQPCTQCHVEAFGPALTSFGRQFKLNSNNSPLSLVVTMTLFGNMASRVQGDVYFTGVHEIIALTNLPLFITCKDLLS